MAGKLRAARGLLDKRNLPSPAILTALIHARLLNLWGAVRPPTVFKDRPSITTEDLFNEFIGILVLLAKMFCYEPLSQAWHLTIVRQFIGGSIAPSRAVPLAMTLSLLALPALRMCSIVRTRKSTPSTRL